MFVYFDRKHAIFTHDLILEKTGGMKGIKDSGHLDCILTLVQNDDYYPELEDKITYLLFSLVKSHVFFDGNKRAALALCSYFLEVNGLPHLIPSFVVNLEDIVVWVAESKINRDLLSRIVFCILYDGSINDELTLEISRAIGALD